MKQVVLLLLLVAGAMPNFAQEARSVTQAIHYIKLANTLRAVRKSDESISLLNRALPAVESRSTYWEAVTNELLGLCHNDLDEYEPAVRYLELARSQYARLRYVASAWGVNEVIRDISGKNLYAGIQIGTSEVTLVIFKTQYESDFYEKDIRSVVSVPNVNLTADASASPKQGQIALQTCLDSIQRYRIPNERVFIVFSSAVANPGTVSVADKARLYEQLASVLPEGSNLRIDTTLTAARDAELFTIGAIPRKVWPSTSALNVGNEQIMAGYFDKSASVLTKPFHYNNAPIGINTVVAQVEATQPADMDAFSREAQRLVARFADTTLVPYSRLVGLQQRRTVGLGGGIAGALVAYLHPEKARTAAVPVSLADAAEFKKRVLNNYESLIQPDLNAIDDRPTRSKAEQDVRAVQNRFTQKQLIAGALLLEAALLAYTDPARPKRFVFIRDSEISWVTGKFLETINYEYESTIAKGALYTR